MKNIGLRLSTIVLGFSLIGISAHAEKMYGVFMVVKGKVQIQAADGKAADAKVGAKIYEGDSVVTVVDARAKIVMADRNVLNISPETTLKIAKYTNDAAAGTKNVELNLVKGKVRTNVEQTYDGDKSQFQIKTPTAVAGVRGTQFLMGFDVKTQSTSIVTFKGSVTLAALGAGGKVIGNPVVVNKGESSSAAADKAPETPKAVPKEEMKKVEGESSVSVQTKETAASPTREVASETTADAPKADAPPSAPEPAKTMIDSKDVDTNIAKEIKDVRVVAPPPPTVAPPPNIPKPPVAIPTLAPNTKTKVIVRPTLPGN